MVIKIGSVKFNGPNTAKFNIKAGNTEIHSVAHLTGFVHSTSAIGSKDKQLPFHEITVY